MRLATVLIATPKSDAPSMFPLEARPKFNPCVTMDPGAATVKGTCAMRQPFRRDAITRLDGDSIQKFRPAGRVNVRNASTAAGFVGEPSTTLPVASSIVWRSIEPAT